MKKQKLQNIKQQNQHRKFHVCPEVPTPKILANTLSSLEILFTQADVSNIKDKENILKDKVLSILFNVGMSHCLLN